MMAISRASVRDASRIRSCQDLSEASAVEYSMLVLKVRNVVVCGHSECGAMKAALAGKPMPETPNLANWLHHATSAVFRLDQEGALDPRLSRHNQLSQLNVRCNATRSRPTPGFSGRLYLQRPIWSNTAGNE
jgi:carbonic anhydrase